MSFRWARVDQAAWQLQPSDLPLVYLPTDLSDEAAATKLVDFRCELTDALERHC